MVRRSDQPRKKRSALNQVRTREMTINLHKRIFGITFRRRAPAAINVVKKFAKRQMKTSRIRIDSKLNNFLWHKGIRSVPFRVRVRLARKRIDDDEGRNKLYTLVTYVPCKNFKGKLNVDVDTDE